MEISFEEVFDIVMELIGCGIVVGILQLMLRSTQIITILERLV